MRDDRHKWAAAPDAFPTLARDTVTLTQRTLAQHWLISGPARADKTPDCITWPDIAQGTTYRLCLRQDQIVQVGGATPILGWDAATSCATTEITDGYTVFALEGRAAMAVLQRGAELSLDVPSRSLLRRVFGSDVILYRHGHESCFRLHVARPEAMGLYRALEIALNAAACAP